MLFKTTRRSALAIATLSLSALPALGQQYPTKPITLIVPYGAGGPTDVLMRTLGEELRKALGQTVVVENRVGASGTMGASALARSRPDGYTLALLPPGVYREPFLTKVDFDPLESFSFILLLTEYVYGLAVRSDSPLRSVADFIGKAREQSGTMTVGAGGGPLGTPALTAEEMADAAGVKIVVVPFKGDADMVNALLGGHIHAAITSGVAVPHIQAGKLRYVGMFTNERVPQFAATPTMREQGVQLAIESPFGVAGPKGMDPATVALLHDAFRAAFSSVQAVNTLAKLNQVASFKNPQEYRQFAEATLAKEKQRIERLRAAGRL